jgi:hypothetical protein
MKDTLKLLSLKELNALMVQTVADLIYMHKKASLSTFREKEKEIELIHAAIITARHM